jgi:hypothetical protein
MPKQDLVDALARAAIDVLLRRAQAAAAVRRDVTLDDLIGLLGGLLIAARGRRAADPKRMLGVVWDGLTVPGSS